MGHTSRNCRSSALTVHSLTTAFNTPEGESLLSSLVGDSQRHTLTGCSEFPLQTQDGQVDLLSSDLSAVPRGSGKHHRLVVMEHDVLPAELDIVVSLQITLAPL